MALTQTNIVLSAGVPVEWQDVNDFFRLLAANGNLDVEYYSKGALIVDAENVTAGYSETFLKQPFDKVKITSATGDTISFVARLGSVVTYDKPPVGNVAVTNTNGAMTNAQASVSNANVTLSPASATRRYARVQNNSAAQWMRLKVDGTNATASAGIRIAPGGYWESPAMFAPTGAINAMMEAADGTANNVEIITG